VDGVEAASFFFGEAHGFDSDDLEAGFVNPSEDFTLLTATDCVGFDDCESALERHERFLRNINQRCRAEARRYKIRKKPRA
jgi:sulfite reductase beta subunit-like hemoprotein